MPWVRFDDNFPNHPKVVGLSNEAFRLHVHVMCSASHFLTDGLVAFGTADREAATIIRALHVSLHGRREAVPGGGEAVDPLVDLPSCNDVVQELLAAGIWRRTRKGYEIHDFAKYQRLRADVEAERAALSAKRADAGRAGAAARWQTGDVAIENMAKTDLPSTPADARTSARVGGVERMANDGKPVANGLQSDGPVPVPVSLSSSEVPSSGKNLSSPHTRALRAPRSSNGFQKPSIGDVATFCKEHGYRLDAEAFIAFYDSNGWKVGGRAAMKDWHAAVVTWVKRDPIARGPSGGKDEAAVAAESKKALEDARAKIARGEGV